MLVKPSVPTLPVQRQPLVEQSGARGVGSTNTGLLPGVGADRDVTSPALSRITDAFESGTISTWKDPKVDRDDSGDGSDDSPSGGPDHDPPGIDIPYDVGSFPGRGPLDLPGLPGDIIPSPDDVLPGPGRPLVPPMAAGQ